MRKMILWLTLCWPFLNQQLTAQTAIEETQFEKIRDVVFKLKVYNKKAKDDALLAELTAFKLEGQSGLFTALHGLTRPGVEIKDLFFVAVTYSPDGSGRQTSKTFDSFELTGLDASRDLAYLKSNDEKFNKLPGLKFAKNFHVIEYMKVYVVGYPSINAPSGRPQQLNAPAMQLLEYMIPSNLDRTAFEKRNSPGIHQKMLQLGPSSIFSGDSGCPIFNEDGELIGMADGGFFNKMNDKISAWAVPMQCIQGDTMQKDENRFRQIAKLSSPTFLMSEEKHNYADNVTPRITLGGTLSRPFWLTAEGVRADLDFKHMNGRFDGYAEVAAGKNWAIGGYVSSRYLQYTILKSFDLSIPLQAERIVRQSKTIDTYGVQVSRIIGRGTVHNTYIGGGYWPVIGNTSEARARFNYRGFVGYRLYAGPRRKLGLEFRAMYVGQNVLEYEWQPTLGNARPIEIIQSLNQWYLCGGLTYSMYRHN